MPEDFGHRVGTRTGAVPPGLVEPARAAALRDASASWPSCDLAAHQVAELELILSGALAPVDRFQTRAAFALAEREWRTPDGQPSPGGVALAVSDGQARNTRPGERLALRDGEGVMLAALDVEDVWQDKDGTWRIGGRLEGLALPEHVDYRSLRRPPAEWRRELAAAGWRRVLAVGVAEVLHRGLERSLLDAASALDAGILVLAGVADARVDDVSHYARVDALASVVEGWGAGVGRLALVPVPLAPRSLPHVARLALVARNCGATHVGLDHTLTGVPALERWLDRLGVVPVPLPAWGAEPATGRLVEIQDDVPPGVVMVSDAEIRRRLGGGLDLPAWLVAPEASRRLKAAHPPRHRRGFTVLFTGYSGSGKSTIANRLRVKLLQSTGRPVTLLDGDLVRKQLSSELGFSREHRDLNVLRIGWVAAEITRHGGIAICAPIAPYADVRARVRAMVEPHGGFVLVHVSTPLEVCERRDRKGLYAKARQGLLHQFTGVSDPYEVPVDAALTIDTTVVSADRAADLVLEWLERQGWIAARAGGVEAANP
jgi:sulfate adenylyltransferase